MLAAAAPLPKKDSTINKLSYSQNVTSTLHYFSTFTAGIEALIIMGYQLLYPPCAFSQFSTVDFNSLPSVKFCNVRKVARWRSK